MPLEKTIKALSESEINRILTTAYDINEKIGMSVESKRLGDFLVKNGAGEDKVRLKLPGDLIKRCLEKSPRSFFFQDRSSNRYIAETGRSYLGTMSDAIEILDPGAQMMLDFMTMLSSRPTIMPGIGALSKTGTASFEKLVIEPEFFESAKRRGIAG